MKLLLLQHHFKAGDFKSPLTLLSKECKNNDDDFIVLSYRFVKPPYFRGEIPELPEVLSDYILVKGDGPIVYQRRTSKVKLTDIKFNCKNNIVYHYDDIVHKEVPIKGVVACYCSSVGSIDETIFRGGFTVYNEDEELVVKTSYFKNQKVHCDTRKIVRNHIEPSRYELLEEALCLGIKNYVHDNGFKTVMLGLSGGVDSALVATMAVKALGPKNVYCYALPSKYSTDHSLSDAKQLAMNLGCHYDIIPIKDTFNTILKTLEPAFLGKEQDLTEENIQARIRGLFLMALSNKHNHLVLATSNKSEVAVGYSTLYGDTVGAIEVIGDLYKTEVYKFCHDINKREGKELIPLHILTKAPSAELRPDQKDSDSLPDYDILDAVIEDYAFGTESMQNLYRRYPSEIVDKVKRLIDINEYKRRQCPFILNVSKTSFSKRKTYITKAFS